MPDNPPGEYHLAPSGYALKAGGSAIPFPLQVFDLNVFYRSRFAPGDGNAYTVALALTANPANQHASLFLGVARGDGMLRSWFWPVDGWTSPDYLAEKVFGATDLEDQGAVFWVYWLILNHLQGSHDEATVQRYLPPDLLGWYHRMEQVRFARLFETLLLGRDERA